jgi:O-antigen/teichoic acid export membrane protein
MPLLWPIHAVNINALMAQGHSKLFFRMEVIKKLIGIALTTSGALFLGLIGLAWCLVLESFIVFAMNTHYSSRFLKYGPLSQIRDMLPSVACAGTMATTVLFLRDVMPQDWPTPTVLCIQIISGAFIYLALLLVFRVAALRAALQVWKDR